MLGIQIGNEFLDLPPGTMLELESDNPFLQFNEELKGSYSLPFEVLATPKNMRLLNYAGIMQQRISNTGIDAMVYQNGIQHSRGKIKIETSNVNLNRVASGKISCYYLTGSSDFFQDIKGKRLREIDMGGVRTFGGGGSFTASAFYAHVIDVIESAPGSFDYAFFPVKNSEWGTDPHANLTFSIELMNKLFLDSGNMTLSSNTPIVPFPYLKLVLLKAVEFVGWKIKGDILDDPDFEKITMINFRSIDWGYVFRLVGLRIIKIRASISFNLADHLPDLSISEFLIGLKNRFAFWYDYDFVNKIITIKSLGGLVSLSQKQFTKYASPLMQKKVKTEQRIYSLKNNFTTGGGQGIDLSVLSYQGEVNKVINLPAAAEALTNHVYLVVEENNYYICIQHDDEIYYWDLHSANIYDYTPDGNNEEISTNATTVEMVMNDAYLDLIPRIDSAGLWSGVDGETPWGVHLCFFHGLRNNKASQPVPFASHHIYDSNGVQVGNWSLAFKGEKTNGDQVGLYDLNWKPFLELLKSSEEFEVTLYLPMHEYLQLKFSDTIIINNVKMFITKINAVIPYNGSVKVECVRILQ